MTERCENPRLVLLFCGKRKSGKDFLTDYLLSAVNSDGNNSAVILRLSGPLKQCYAENHQLDYSRLLDASDYKEKHRKDMITWSEKIRNDDPSYFCNKSIEMFEAEKFPVWIVSDCRRKSDFEFFDSNYAGRVKKIRVKASEETRHKRGFAFQAGVDDAESECGLDDAEVEYDVENNGDCPPEQLLRALLQSINELTSI